MNNLEKRVLILGLSSIAVILTAVGVYRITKPLFLELDAAKSKEDKQQIVSNMLKASFPAFLLGTVALGVLDYSYKSIK